MMNSIAWNLCFYVGDCGMAIMRMAQDKSSTLSTIVKIFVIGIPSISDPRSTLMRGNERTTRAAEGMRLNLSHGSCCMERAVVVAIL